LDKEVNQILPGIEMTAVPPADSAELADVATAPADTAISGRKVDQAFPGIEMPGVIPADSAAVAADATASTDTTHSGNEVDEALAGIGMTEVPAASGVRNGEDGEAGSRTSSAGRRKKWEDPRKKLDETILAVAEIYRDRLAMPDSAIHFYLEFTRRFPESHQVPRAIYSIAWIRTEMKGDEESAAPWLQRLVQDFPLTEHANAARELLGHVRDVTAEQRALEEYERIEKIRLEDIDSLDRYMPEFDRLIAEYPATESGARALWLTAWTYENVAGDTTAAEDRYARIAEEFPGTLLATHALERGEARAEGLLDKLEREFITLRGGEKPGEKVTTIAVEPDTADSVLLARKYLGFALRAHRRGVLETAREYYELCLQEKQRSPEALFGLGEIAWEGAYFDDALDYFHDSLRMRGNLVGVYYRLFAVHTREGRADSSNHYLREILRKDRDNPAVISLRDEFPTLESEDLDMSTLEEIDLPLPPPEDLYAPPRSLLPLREEAVVRKSSLPVLPAGAEVDSAEVIVDILVTVEGKPAVVEAFVGDESLVPEALETARQYVFFPAIDLDGEKAEVWVEIAIPFYPSRGTDPRPTSESVAGGADSILPETVAANDGVPVATVPSPVQRQATDSGSGQQETE
jgi:tetratricopeptide (TPR) repeat protein